MVAGMQVPTLDEITKKEQTIKEALNYKFNDKDIEDVSPSVSVLLKFSGLVHFAAIRTFSNFCLNTLQIVKEKDRFRKAPPNYAMKKTQLLKDKVKETKHLERDTESTYYVHSCVCRPAMSMFFLYSLCLQAMAEESGDGDKAKVIQDELNELEERAEALDRQRTKNISAIRCKSCTRVCDKRAIPKFCEK